MKVTAVIPAKAETKGIPNRNLRFINGKPLVYYAINNAKKSSMINEIIVSTDSKEVEIVASQLGAQIHQRMDELLEDSVTLDRIAYDVVKEIDTDYVVILQPTSPILKDNTLDLAIDYAVKNSLDALFSVVNSPQLSWTKENGKLLPLYDERKNRKFLPPYYIETGSFVIRKKSAIADSTKLTGKIDIFETDQEEAIEIRTFLDLQQVENIITKKQVGIYVNGNNVRGVGHIYRSLELADEFYCEPDIYYDINQTERTVFGSTMHNLIPVNGIGELLAKIADKQYDVFINDILTTSIDYMIALRTSLPKAKIVNFEDDGEGIYKADLVFNSLYSEELLPQVKAGEKYFIANKSFLFYEPIKIAEEVNKIFICFGGADPRNYSERLLSIVSRSAYKRYKFMIVLGRAKKDVEKIMEYNKYENITVFYDVDNMPELMSQCDMAITSRGRTGYELALMGIPTIAIAQNRREEKHGFVCNENGFTYIGLDPDDEIIEGTLNMYLSMSKKSRLRFQNMLLNHDLRSGRKRVIGLITNL